MLPSVRLGRPVTVAEPIEKPFRWMPRFVTFSESPFSAANAIEAWPMVAIVSSAGVIVMSLAESVIWLNSVNENVAMSMLKRPGFAMSAKSKVLVTPVIVEVTTGLPGNSVMLPSVAVIVPPMIGLAVLSIANPVTRIEAFENVAKLPIEISDVVEMLNVPRLKPVCVMSSVGSVMSGKPENRFALTVTPVAERMVGKPGVMSTEPRLMVSASPSGMFRSPMWMFIRPGASRSPKLNEPESEPSDTFKTGMLGNSLTPVAAKLIEPATAA